jgi:hypothetical protein
MKYVVCNNEKKCKHPSCRHKKRHRERRIRVSDKRKCGEVEYLCYFDNKVVRCK